MPEIREIEPDAAAVEIGAEGCTVLDIRDEASFAAGRIPGALRLDGRNAASVLADLARDRMLIVCCYHGISSRMAAGWLAGQGFTSVHSLSGGYEAWSGTFPDRCEADRPL